MLRRKLVAGSLIVTALSSVTPVLAGTFSVPDELSLLFLNGEKVPSSFFRHTKSVEIDAGPTNIIVKYEDVISGEISDDHTVFESLPFALNFFAQADRDYQVVMTLPRNEEEARSFSNKPVVKLSDDGNNWVVLEIKYQKSEQEEKLKTLFSSEAKTSRKLKSATKLSASGQIDMPGENDTPEQLISVPQKSDITQPQPQPQPQPLHMLNYWWQQASPSQRLEFKKMTDLGR